MGYCMRNAAIRNRTTRWSETRELQERRTWYIWGGHHSLDLTSLSHEWHVCSAQTGPSKLSVLVIVASAA